MSNRELLTPVLTDICDWCEDPMDKYDEKDGMFHDPKTASIVSGYISHPTNDKRVNKFYFLWNRREERKREVRYDFHSRCFDDMVKVAFKQRDVKPAALNQQDSNKDYSMGSKERII